MGGLKSSPPSSYDDYGAPSWLESQVTFVHNPAWFLSHYHTYQYHTIPYFMSYVLVLLLHNPLSANGRLARFSKEDWCLSYDMLTGAFLNIVRALLLDVEFPLLRYREVLRAVAHAWCSFVWFLGFISICELFLDQLSPQNSQNKCGCRSNTAKES